MQTTIIGQVIGDALGLAPQSADVKQLVEWRSGGDQMGINAGNFALSCVEVRNLSEYLSDKWTQQADSRPMRNVAIGCSVPHKLWSSVGAPHKLDRSFETLQSRGPSLITGESAFSICFFS